MALFAIPAVLLLSYTVLPNWEARIRIAGMSLELLGLSTVAFGLRDTRKLFSQPSFLLLAARWMISFPSFYRNVHIVAGTGHFKLGGASVTGLATASSSASASLEERVAILEKNLEQSNLAIHQAQRRLDDESARKARAVESERQYRETADDKNRQLLEEAMAGGLHLEAIGVLWLFVGIILATASSEIESCITG